MPPGKTLRQVLIINPPGRRELIIPPEQHFVKNFFPEQKEGGEDYVVEKNTKINKGIGHKF